MSLSLARKSLQLVESTEISQKGKNKKGKKIIDTPKKEIGKKSTKKRKPEDLGIPPSKSIRTIDQIRKEINKKDNVIERKIATLKSLHKPLNIDKKTKKLILQKAVAPSYRIKNKVKKDKKKSNSKSVFTEEDFKKFEEEYFDD